MARFVYYTATSLDGFIADENNSLDWLFEVARDPDDKSWDAFLAGIGAMVMGSTTYEWVLAHDDLLVHPERWHGYYADRPCWVFTHRDLPAIPGVDLRFVRGDVETAYDDLVAAAGERDVWLVGGGDLVGQFDDAGHLDEVQLGICPGVPRGRRPGAAAADHVRAAHAARRAPLGPAGDPRPRREPLTTARRRRQRAAAPRSARRPSR